MSILAPEHGFSVVVSVGPGKNEFYRTFELIEQLEQAGTRTPLGDRSDR
jgi:hypothetical protein